MAAVKGILGRKLGMTQIWDANNRVIPVTVIEAGPCRVVQLKTPERDGYSAVQIAFGVQKESRVSKPELGHLAKAGAGPARELAELRVDDLSPYAVGQVIAADVFAGGERVDVTSISKGKGFAGVMKRHNFKGQGASHGNHKKHRAPGSIGACATPARVFKGMKMAGQMGAQRTTTLNLEVVEGDAERGLLLIKGSVPGSNGSVVFIRNAVKGPAVAPPVFATVGAVSAAPAAAEAPTDDIDDEIVADAAAGETEDDGGDGVNIDVKTTAGSVVGLADLPDELFGVEPNMAVMHQVVTAQLAHRRAGTHSTKTRAEVAGGGAKPWRQKGTGRARQGSTRAPHWRGGGVAHGPKPRDYSQRTPKKMVRLALASALSDRAANERVLVVDSWGIDEPRTKRAIEVLDALGLRPADVKPPRLLVVLERGEHTVWKSLRNLGNRVQIILPEELNTYDILLSDYLIFSTATLDAVTRHFGSAE